MADKKPQVVVIGAGVGGLTAASLLLKAGFPVTILEAHVYAGGSASTFFPIPNLKFAFSWFGS